MARTGPVTPEPRFSRVNHVIIAYIAGSVMFFGKVKGLYSY